METVKFIVSFQGSTKTFPENVALEKINDWLLETFFWVVWQICIYVFSSYHSTNNKNHKNNYCRFWNSWMKELKTRGKHWMKIENSWKTFNENWKFMENIEWKLCFDLIWNKNSLMTKKNTFIYYLNKMNIAQNHNI